MDTHLGAFRQERAERGEPGNLVDDSRDLVRFDREAGGGAVGHADASHGFAAVLGVDLNVDSGARPPGDLDHRRACRVEADAVDLDVGAGRPRRQRDPERCARHIAGHDQVPGAQLLPADDGDGFADFSHPHAKFVKCALGVIARRHGLEHGRFSVGLQAGQEHGALDLRARDFRDDG